MKLGRKNYTISVKTGTDANKAKFKKECVQGEIYHATDTGFFYVAEVTAGANDATLSQFGEPAFTSNLYSLSFDGTNDYLLMGESAISLDTNFTISAWFKPTSNALSGYDFMCGWGNNASGQARVMQILNSKLSFEIYFSRISGSTTLSADTWYHGAVTFSGNDVEIFLNGSSDGAGTLSRSTMSSSLTFARRYTCHDRSRICTFFRSDR